MLQEAQNIVEVVCFPLPKPFRAFHLPSKDKTSANAVKRQMSDLSHKISNTLQPIHVFISRKLEERPQAREIKLPIINQQNIVYSFPCDLCDSDSVYTINMLLNIKTL